MNGLESLDATTNQLSLALGPIDPIPASISIESSDVDGFLAA
jgi:hypothetical protein